MPNSRNRRRPDIKQDIDPEKRKVPVSEPEETTAASPDEQMEPPVSPVKTNWVN